MPPAAPVIVAEVVHRATAGEQGRCNYTRGELAAMLERSGYGVEDPAMYAAFFRRDADGRHLCISCGFATGFHDEPNPDESNRKAAAAAANHRRRSDAGTPQVTPTHRPMDIPPPNRRLLEPGAPALLDAVPFPAHWRGGAWFARMLRFEDYDYANAVHMDDDAKQRVPVRWRCTALSSDGRGECGALLVTMGVVIDRRRGLPIDGAVVSLVPNTGGAAGSLEAHFRDAHRISHTPPAATNGRWTTGLDDCCAEPSVACSWLAFPCGIPCGMSNGRGQSFCEALDRAAPNDKASQIFVRQFDRDGTHCAFGGMAASALFTFMAVPFIVTGAVFSVLCCCGEPCDGPPLVCVSCYTRRRDIVQAIGAEESPSATRWITVCCWPCSECQQWRELRNSGVWPGLLCCTASEQDRALMSAAAVSARYGLDGAGGLHAVSPDRECAALGSLSDRPYPAVAWAVMQ